MDTSERHPAAFKRDLSIGIALAALYGAMALPATLMAPVDATGVLQSLVLAIPLVALSVVDLRSYRLPDALTLPLAAAGLFRAALLSPTDLLDCAIAALFGWGLLYAVAAIYRRLRGREGLGLGDAKLIAASGAWLGIEGLPLALLMACVAALSAVLIARLAKHGITAATRVAFGPFLAAGTWIVWLYATWI